MKYILAILAFAFLVFSAQSSEAVEVLHTYDSMKDDTQELASQYPEIAIYSIIPIPVIIWGSFRFQSRIGPHYTEVRKEVGLLNALLSNNLSGISTIKSFTSEELEIERVRAASQAYREANRRAIRLSAAFVPLIRMAILVGFTATLLHGGIVTLNGGMEVASYSVMIFMRQRLL